MSGSDDESEKSINSSSDEGSSDEEEEKEKKIKTTSTIAKKISSITKLSNKDDDEDDDEDIKDEDEEEDIKEEDEEEEDIKEEEAEDSDVESSSDSDPDSDTETVKTKKPSTTMVGGATPDYENVVEKSNGGDDEDEDEDDDDDEEMADGYLQKFNTDINRQYLTEFHPESIINNYDEINALSIVIRDGNNNIIDKLHRTLPYLTKYERARVLGQRAKQINSGAKAFVKVPENVIDGYLIAEMELLQKRVPFIVRRPIPGGGCEYWKLRDLEIIGF
jgi:DNA-directed RNA polymerase I, II, and III subunit RPABC2